jgi:hypothetical protein
MCVSTEFNVLAKTHVCFHQEASQALLHGTQVPKHSPHLTFAVSAAIALAATLFIHQGIAATLWAEITSYA